MGNLCSCGESTRGAEIQIGELRNDIARLARRVEETEERSGVRRATSGNGSDTGRIYNQMTVTTRGRSDGGRVVFTGSWSSEAVGPGARRRRARNAVRYRS